jgi:hypothetical protein
MPSMLKTLITRWGPAILLMAVIFSLSARPSAEMPHFGGWDYFVKKGGHMLGYGLLALSYWRGMSLHPARKWIAWGLAVCYGITDEIHQGYVPGRHAALTDALFFDNLGAMLAVILWDRFGMKLAWRVGQTP